MAALSRGSRHLLFSWNKHVALAFARPLASKTPVGFIGLGNMGSPMAKNLLKNSYPVIATDIFPESCKELQDLGAQVVDSPAEVAEKADRIITMLPSSPNVIEVYKGPSGILKKVKKGTLLIDSSTIDPAVSKEMALAADKMGAVFMDAPVSGGVGAANMAKLTFMVGGVEEEYQAAQELLTCMGANVVYCGEVGNGQAAKICNNMLLAIGMIGTAETMNLGIRILVWPKTLLPTRRHPSPWVPWPTRSTESCVPVATLTRTSHPSSSFYVRRKGSERRGSTSNCDPPPTPIYAHLKYSPHAPYPTFLRRNKLSLETELPTN
ncbi:3-hydroxyisobutyrate dehydrogenase a isoform X2 [Thalassophryne amazonica]|uniref:3-hydroxyisobutyrate dehydrogenase a isoform X2 n=1 Tax=Thalassophryne amazonica TaxID=390379 RepID=UPI001471C774|nr:3-hydroxyisobutyrate dehydrogenase a isoform X2 [Thalassophryne amazonica]